MSHKLKKNDPPKLQASNSVKKECLAPDESVYFNFRYLTKDKRYNLEYLNSGDSRLAAKQLLKKIVALSQSSWADLLSKGKRTGGFNTIPIANFHANITDQMRRDNLSDDTKLHVFRFGNYRLVGLKGERCKAVIHVLGFDWDFSLYKHE